MYPSVILLIAWSNVLGTQYLLPTNQTKKFTTSVVLGAIINIVTNIPLIYMFGALGATVATIISEFSVTVYQLYVLRKQIKTKRLFAEFHKFIVSGVVMLLIVCVLDWCTPKTWGMIFIEIVIGMFSYVSMLLILKVNYLNKLAKLLKK